MFTVINTSFLAIVLFVWGCCFLYFGFDGIKSGWVWGGRFLGFKNSEHPFFYVLFVVTQTSVGLILLGKVVSLLNDIVFKNTKPLGESPNPVLSFFFYFALIVVLGLAPFTLKIHSAAKKYISKK
jgi:hypothetical protein